MTKFEYTWIIGTRAVQISKNSPVLIELNNETDPIKIAELELL